MFITDMISSQTNILKYTTPNHQRKIVWGGSKDEFQALLHEILGSCPPPCTDEPHFQAVDGAIDRVCRGLTPTDNANSHLVRP